MTPPNKLIVPIIALVVAGLILFRNYILRKRLARHTHYASIQAERYRQFVESCPDALLVLEDDGSIVSANTHACKLLKMDCQDLLAHAFWGFIDPVSLTELRKQFSQCLSGKPMHCQAHIQIGNGPGTPIEVNGSLQLVEGKSLVQLYVRDKSVLRETEEQVRSLYNQLEEVTAELEEQKRKIQEQPGLAHEELIAFINHRIRTPLDGIMGMGQLLADTPLNMEQYSCVNTILISASNLLNVISSMSEASEEISEETELQAEFVDLRELCEKLSIKHGPTAIRKGIELRCDCQSNVPQHVLTDEKQLNRVLSNLLESAIKYTVQGLVMLNIECRRKNSDDAEIYFQVIDTGLGTDEAFRSGFYESSVQAREDRLVRMLDLASCRQGVEQMGGTIGQTITRGNGSTFYFALTFPLELPQSAMGVAEPAHPVDAPCTSPIQDARVLVVDDNKICQKVVVAMLHKAGCKVDVANNGKEALTQIREKHFDVVLMDCQMPVMDGHEATVSIRSMAEPYRSMPIIALTAHSLKHELQTCLDSGMDGCLVKPIERQKLIDAVTGYIDQARIGTVLVRAS